MNDYRHLVTAALVLVIVLVGNFVDDSRAATDSYRETVSWVATASAFGLAVIAVISHLAGVPVNRLGLRRALALWLLLDLAMAFALFADWAMFWRDRGQGFGSVLFQWSGLVLIWGLFLIAPQWLAAGSPPGRDSREDGVGNG